VPIRGWANEMADSENVTGRGEMSSIRSWTGHVSLGGPVWCDYSLARLVWQAPAFPNGSDCVGMLFRGFGWTLLPPCPTMDFFGNGELRRIGRERSRTPDWKVATSPVSDPVPSGSGTKHSRILGRTAQVVFQSQTVRLGAGAPFSSVHESGLAV
jgi:hypothetical protein